MKILICMFTSLFLIACSSKRSTIGNPEDVIGTEIENDTFDVYNYLDILPHAFEINHSSEIVKGYTEQLNDWPYKWHFKTSVKNISKKELTMVSFGILAWDNGRWVIDEKQENFNSGIIGLENFSDWYNCPNGIIKPGETFTDSNNWAGSYGPEPFAQKWFYLGKDKKGNFYIGESNIKFE